jgi:hypothetical protein
MVEATEVKSVTGNIAVSLDRYVVKDRPFDPHKDWTNGPSDWKFKYSCTKSYYPI